MPNPQGTNSFDRFGAETSYGAIKRLTDSTKGAPLAGQQAATSALETPRRAKRRAARPDQRQPPPIPSAAAAAPSLPPLADAWAELAALPGASDLVKQFAQEAQNAA